MFFIMEKEIFLDWSPIGFLEEEKEGKDLTPNPPKEELKIYYF